MSKKKNQYSSMWVYLYIWLVLIIKYQYPSMFIFQEHLPLECKTLKNQVQKDIPNISRKFEDEKLTGN